MTPLHRILTPTAAGQLIPNDTLDGRSRCPRGLRDVHDETSLSFEPFIYLPRLGETHC